ANVATFLANSQRQLTLAESGTYTIQVNANNLVTTGNYNLGLECLRPRGLIDATLTCGGLVSEAISAPGEVDLVSFGGQANDIVLLTLVDTAGWSALGSRAQATVIAPSGAN